MDDHAEVEQISLAFHMRSREADLLVLITAILEEMQNLDGFMRENLKAALPALRAWREALSNAADNAYAHGYVNTVQIVDNELRNTEQAARCQQIDSFIRNSPQFRDRIDNLRNLTADLLDGWLLFRRTHT